MESWWKKIKAVEKESKPNHYHNHNHHNASTIQLQSEIQWFEGTNFVGWKFPHTVWNIPHSAWKNIPLMFSQILDC